MLLETKLRTSTDFRKKYQQEPKEMLKSFKEIILGNLGNEKHIKKLI